MGVFISLDDVDKHYEVAKAVGAEIVHPPKDVDTAEPTGRSIPRDIPGSSPRLGNAMNLGGMGILFVVAALTLAACPRRRRPVRRPLRRREKAGRDRAASSRRGRGGIRQRAVQSDRR